MAVVDGSRMRVGGGVLRRTSEAMHLKNEGEGWSAYEEHAQSMHLKDEA